MSDVTHILERIDAGDSGAADRLLPLIYGELRRLAAQKMAEEKPGHTLQATALVHEAYLRLVGPQAAACWESRGHFYSAAAEAMRRILVESARKRKRRARNGGSGKKCVLDQELTINVNEIDVAHRAELVDLDAALDRLAESDPQAAQVVKLRFFAGLNNEQTAATMGVSVKTIQREWAYARAWLGRALGDAE
ncbi:MAG: ECF-type sigma factor [Planctomycetaceae bacterium]